jgi:hypothetical protein
VAAGSVAASALSVRVSEAVEACLKVLGDGTGLGYPERQGVLLELLLAGVPAALSEPPLQQGYLAYHRDWLVRYPILNRGMGLAKVYQVFDLFEEQAKRLGTPPFEALAGSVGRHVAEPIRREWTGALKVLVAAAGEGRQQEDGREDPFAADRFFPVLFRVFHAAAGHYDIALLDEAFLHHLLLRGLGATDGRERFSLAPHLQHLPDPGTEPVRRPAGSFEEGYDWRALVSQSGGAAKAWVTAYASHDGAITGPLEKALHVMRKGRLEEGGELLKQAGAHREQLRDKNPGAYELLGRFYHGERAYYEYMLGNLSEAEAEMDRAAGSVHRAIELHTFLLPAAPLLVDIPLQKARVARARRDWQAMERHLTEMYEMEVGRRPLCVLADGQSIDYAVLAGHFSTLQLEGPQRAMVERLLAVENRLRDFRQLTTKLYLIPGMVKMSK